MIKVESPISMQIKRQTVNLNIKNIASVLTELATIEPIEMIQKKSLETDYEEIDSLMDYFERVR